MLAIFLIVGLGVSPIYASAMKSMEQSAQASSMAGMADDGMADDMPCHPAKSPSGKDLSVHGRLPVIMLSRHAAGRQRYRYSRYCKIAHGFSEPTQQLASLAPSPPARPPRA